ncbi:MAG: sigma-70 family RNA polymerase sigma factor [Bacteroidetes bacterium]|nr:sigma-70 family RNA polymerase sigma factor [Bacteroidota bacterium]MBL6943113.1 sigma-70 family RNA polymerase sigma factor [Bacteroidales bacterium]
MKSKLQKDHQLQIKEDQCLWRDLKHSHPEALNSLFIKYYSDFYFYGLKLVGNHDLVVDTIQDLFASVWESRKRISEVNHVKAYLFAALRNNLLKPTAKDIIGKDTGINIENDYSFDISPEDIYLNNEAQLENMKLIGDMLAELSPKQKEIIYLKFFCNYSNIEISSVLSIKYQSVSNMLTRTLNLLRKKTKENRLLILIALIFMLL